MAATFDTREHPHRRFNPLTREWVLVSPHRTERPWQGQVESVARTQLPSYDPTCYLCPGNSRADGHQNPNYTSTFIFENGFAALKPDVPDARTDVSGLLVTESERGQCRVLCFSPDHSLTLAHMDVSSITNVVEICAEQYKELGALAYVSAVQIFENRGEMMGMSNPHPHGQIWASQTLPNELWKEDASQLAYTEARGGCLLCDYLSLERREGARIVCENESFAALVPFWANWPFETMIVGGRHRGSIDELDSKERAALASILKRLTTRYDNLFETSFPYTMGFHQQPTDGRAHTHFHFHAHFYPPLLLSATIRKFMVGFELLGTPQRDITAETAAERLRALSEKHYLEV